MDALGEGTFVSSIAIGKLWANGEQQKSPATATVVTAGETAEGKATVSLPFPSASADAGAEVFWEINTVLRKRNRKKGGGVEYLVSWQGFPSAADNTWEPHENLMQDCPLLLQQFLASPAGASSAAE